MSIAEPMPSPDMAAGPAPLFAALGDPTRLSLLNRLGDGQPRSIVELSAGAGVSRQAVTKHLRVLENAGLVESRRIGRESRYAFRGQRIAAMRDYLDGVSRQWDEALGRLQAFVEG